MELRSPKEILDDANSERIQFGDKLITDIAAALESDYSGGVLKIWVSYDRSQIEKSFSYIQAVMTKKGWCIELKRSNSWRNESNVELEVWAKEG